MSPKRALAIQHVAFEDLDGFERPLRDAGFTITFRHAANGLANIEDYDLLMVLGGPVGVDDQTQYPFLIEEARLLEQALSAEKPIMAVCLGAQLLAHVLGSHVYAGAHAEIGCAPISLSAAGQTSCLTPFKDQPMAFHWHRDTFDLPNGAIRLARTDACENQAFSYGHKVIACQFHPEFTGRTLEHWLVGHAHELAHQGITPDLIRTSVAQHHQALTTNSARVMSTFLSHSTEPTP